MQDRIVLSQSRSESPGHNVVWSLLIHHGQHW